MVIVSRLNENQVWNGTVTSVDYNNTQNNTYDALYGSYDSLSSSTNYPFYVALENTDGLLLGQHVYVRLAGVNEKTGNRILLPESYLMNIQYDAETLISSAQIWCVNEEGKLMQAKVVLGEFVLDSGCYVILSGLTMDDYVADPSNPGCAEGVTAMFRSEGDFVHATVPPTETTETTEPPAETTEPPTEATEPSDEAPQGDEFDSWEDLV